MQIVADKLSKRYFYHWIIKDFDYNFVVNESYAISGRNGSGKSTLIKLLSGHLSPSSGKVYYSLNSNEIRQSSIFSHISLAAPYTDIIQEFSLEENFIFHQKFKLFKYKVTFKEFLELIELASPKDKPLRFFSSGMKQKVQLALAILSNTPILLLDEPTSYLDSHARIWFRNFLHGHSIDRIIIIASNDSFDIEQCQKIITLDTSGH